MKKLPELQVCEPSSESCCFECILSKFCLNNFDLESKIKLILAFCSANIPEI